MKRKIPHTLANSDLGNGNKKKRNDGWVFARTRIRVRAEEVTGYYHKNINQPKKFLEEINGIQR